MHAHVLVGYVSRDQERNHHHEVKIVEVIVRVLGHQAHIREQEAKRENVHSPLQRCLERLHTLHGLEAVYLSVELVVRGGARLGCRPLHLLKFLNSSLNLWLIVMAGEFKSHRVVLVVLGVALVLPFVRLGSVELIGQATGNEFLDAGGSARVLLRVLLLHLKLI